MEKLFRFRDTLYLGVARKRNNFSVITLLRAEREARSEFFCGLKAAAHYAIRRAECRVRGGDTATFSENGATFRLGGRRNSKSRRRMSLTGVSAERRKKAEPVQLFRGMSRPRTRTAARQTFFTV